MLTPAKFIKIPFESTTTRFAPASQYPGTLEEYGYIEEEWFATGEENGRTFTTLVIIRKPKDPNKFSGTVVVEPLHFYPITPIFVYTSRYLMRSGHAWVCICSQKSSLDICVKPANQERYAPLNIIGDELSPVAAKMDLLTVASSSDYDGLLWWETLNSVNRASRYILAQVGAALKTPAGPFGGYEIKNSILGGHSYTGYVTTRYIREAHETLRLADGAPVYDGFFPSGWPSKPFGPCDVPIIQTLTSADICTDNIIPFRMLYSGLDYRRPDSDEANDRYRLYEFSGFGHTSTQYPPINEIKFLEVMDPSLSLPEGAKSSNLPFCEMHHVALHHLIRWVSGGVIPPRAERMVEGDPNVIFARDEHGNILGGVRCAQMDVPHSKYVSNLPMPDGSLRFGGYGIEEPFDKSKLQSLYKSKENYLVSYKKRLNELVHEGWYLEEDIAWVLTDAEKVEFG